jgi:hypothetical protein
MRHEAGQLYAAIRSRAGDAFAEAQPDRRCAAGKEPDAGSGGYDIPEPQFFYIANKVSIQMVLLGRKYVPHWDKATPFDRADIISPLGLKNLIKNRPNLQLAMEVRYLTGVVPKLGGQSRLSSRG